MSNIFAPDVETAKELIALFGEDCLWHKPAPVDGGTPGYPGEGETPEPVACKIAWFNARDIGRGGTEFLSMMKGTELPLVGEIGLLAGGLTFTPELLDHVERADASLRAIHKIDKLAPNGLPILYYVTVTG